MTGLKRLLFLRSARSKGLPDEYQRVEYIEGTGTQYIDSGIECTSDLIIDCEFSVSTTTNYALCGGINNTPPVFRHHANPSSYGANYNYMYSITNSGDTIPVTIATPQLDTKYRVVIDPVAGTYLFTGEDYYESGTFTPFEFCTTGKSYGILGRISHAGAIQSRPNKTYYFKFFRDGRLIGDFVPCYRKSDFEPGMYDFVTKAFFTNAGTDSIIVGPDI